MQNPDASKNYTCDFYSSINAGSLAAANCIVPFIISLFPSLRSVVDIGCGAGAWLSVFAKYGMMIDGYDFGCGAKEELLIAPEHYHEADLRAPLTVSTRYDMAISLEVGEHMEEDRAGQLVDTLTSLSGLILFSAAIPGQPGTDHINCQWPEWWAEKFSRKGLKCYDVLRPVFWRLSAVPQWYRQNIMIFANLSAISDQCILADLQRLSRFADFKCAPLLHPKWHNLMD